MNHQGIKMEYLSHKVLHYCLSMLSNHYNLLRIQYAVIATHLQYIDTGLYVP